MIKWNLDPCISPVLILLWISWYNFSQVAEYSLKLDAHRFHRSAYHPWIRRLWGIFLLPPVFSRLKDDHKNILRFSTRPWFIWGWGWWWWWWGQGGICIAAQAVHTFCHTPGYLPRPYLQTTATYNKALSADKGRNEPLLWVAVLDSQP